MKQINVFRANKFTFRISQGTKYFKIGKLVFNKTDGSIFLTFPYFKDLRGIVASCILPASGIKTHKINLEEWGKITSHMVKFAHHPDGRVHFSQTGRVRTEIERQSKPLNKPIQHFGTIYAQGFSGFKYDESAESKSNISSRDQILTFNFKESKTKAYKIIISHYSLEEASRRIQSSNRSVGPNIITVDPTGTKHQIFLISSTKDTPGSNMFMKISVEEIPSLTKERDSHLMFIGGFDPLEISDDLSKPTGFLLLSYPITNYEDLQKRIGSIDWRPVK